MISDIHLGAGEYINGKKNVLEDFHYDQEMVDFLNYFSTGHYSHRSVELIINGDFFDLLAVPYVEYFDDEFWSEEAALEKMKMIVEAHPEVMSALNEFAGNKNKSIVFIVGNHDGELLFKSLQEYLLDQFSSESKKNVKILAPKDGQYCPIPEVALMHGHEYEVAHHIDPETSIVEDEQGKKFFIPPWGSYYVTRIVNKFKPARNHINAVKPISHFMINGIIYDTLFTLRFIFSTCFYFFMVRFIYFFKLNHSLRDTLNSVASELEVFQDYDNYAEKFFHDNPDIKALIVGHTHEPRMRNMEGGKTFINTGTWTDMYYLDFELRGRGKQLPFAQVDCLKENGNKENSIEVNLHVWQGKRDLPYIDF